MYVNGSGRSAFAAVLSAITLVVAACASPVVTPRTPSIVPTPTMELFGVAWTGTDQVVVTHGPGHNRLTRLATISLSDGKFAALPEPPSEGCLGVQLGPPTTVSSGVVAVVRTCIPEPGRGPDRFDVYTLDLATGTYAMLGSAAEIGSPPGVVAISPNGTRAMLGLGTLCGVIVEATLDGPTTLPVTITGPSSEFRLDDVTRGPDCAQRGWVEWPTWAPSGDSIAFFAAPDAIGMLGPDRAFVPASLYVTKLDDSQASALLSGVVVPRGLRYAPDGGLLAFSGTIDGQPGVWTFDPSSNDLVKLYDQTFSWLDWSPDGGSIVGLETAGDPDAGQLQVVVIATQVK